MKPLHAIAFFVAGTALMMFLWRSELLLLLLMSLASLLILSIDKWKNLRMFLVAMVVGGICENLAVMLGAWDYSNAGFLYAPLYLPVGWGMCVVLLEEAFATNAHKPGFSKRAALMSFGGTYLVGIIFPSEALTLLAFVFITGALILSRYFHPSEMKAGVYAAILGTAMETACIISGNWHYNATILNGLIGVAVPIWLPLCWFNAFLIMRRIAN